MYTPEAYRAVMTEFIRANNVPARYNRDGWVPEIEFDLHLLGLRAISPEGGTVTARGKNKYHYFEILIANEYKIVVDYEFDWNTHYFDHNTQSMKLKEGAKTWISQLSS